MFSLNPSVQYSAVIHGGFQGEEGLNDSFYFDYEHKRQFVGFIVKKEKCQYDHISLKLTGITNYTCPTASRVWEAQYWALFEAPLKPEIGKLFFAYVSEHCASFGTKRKFSFF